jgi:acyl-CoA thioesterase
MLQSQSGYPNQCHMEPVRVVLMSEDLARAVAAAMWADDAASAGLGMRLVSVGPGRAVLEMPVRADMVNGHGIAHGGFVFTLADSAFAFACNSRNRRTVAQACDIVFVIPARLGDVLVAEAVERTTYGRNGIYDVTVRRGDDELVAEFRGRSRQIDGTFIEEES